VTNTTRTTATTKATTVPTNRPVTAKARKINAICARKRTAVYKNTHQKNVSALKSILNKI
jgi:hypothetical protein